MPKGATWILLQFQASKPMHWNFYKKSENPWEFIHLVKYQKQWMHGISNQSTAALCFRLQTLTLMNLSNNGSLLPKRNRPSNNLNRCTSAGNLSPKLNQIRFL